MNLQEKAIKEYFKVHTKLNGERRPTLQYISKDLDIQITRVHRIMHGQEMKLTEYEKFLRSIEKSKTIGLRRRGRPRKMPFSFETEEEMRMSELLGGAHFSSDENDEDLDLGHDDSFPSESAVYSTLEKIEAHVDEYETERKTLEQLAKENAEQTHAATDSEQPSTAVGQNQ